MTSRLFLAGLVSLVLAVARAEAPSAESSLDCIDPLIGTEGVGSEYGGMMPMVSVPFGSFQMVPMTRLNRVGRVGALF